MVSSLDAKMHMQLQTAVCAQGVCTQLDAACTANRLQTPYDFIHACRLCLHRLSYSRLPCHCLRQKKVEEEKREGRLY